MKSKQPKSGVMEYILQTSEDCTETFENVNLLRVYYWDVVKYINFISNENSWYWIEENCTDLNDVTSR